MAPLPRVDLVLPITEGSANLSELLSSAELLWRRRACHSNGTAAGTAARHAARALNGLSNHIGTEQQHRGALARWARRSTSESTPSSTAVSETTSPPRPAPTKPLQPG
jgi:hypothetical protein